MNVIQFKQIGVIHSPFTCLENMPIQPPLSNNAMGKIEIFPEYLEGLRDLEGFSHIVLLYHFHKADVPRLTLAPFLDQQEHGIFATCAPVRPNAIGLSIVELVSREKNILTIKNLDMLDGTPLIDIKPYIEKFHHPLHSKTGWLEGKEDRFETTKSDSRFGIK